MSEMIGGVPETVKNRIGADIVRTDIPTRDETFKKRVFLVANGVHNVLNLTEENRDTVVRDSENIVKSLTKAGEWEASSVNELIATSQDRNKPLGNQEIAKARLEQLALGTTWAMLHGGNTELTDILGSGSTYKIREILPEPLKGLEGMVRKYVVSNENIASTMNGLDDVRENCSGGTPRDKKVLREEMEATFAQLSRLKGLGPEGKDELRMVKTYLNTELGEDLGGGLIGSGEHIVERTSRIGRGLDLFPFGVDPKSPMAGAQMRASEQVSLPEVMVDVGNKSKTMAWIQKIIVEKLPSNPLSFAQWWQSGLCTQLDSLINEKISATDFGTGDSVAIEAVKQQAREYYRKGIYSSAVAIGYLQMFANCDQTLPTLKSWAPPAEMAEAYRWSEESVDFLKDEPLTAVCYKRVFDWAYENREEFEGRGWMVVEAVSLKNGDLTKMNNFCNKMVEEIVAKNGGEAWKNYAKDNEIDPNDYQALANATRIALNMFWVENGAEYINFLNKTRSWEKTNGVADKSRSFKWFDYEPGEPGVTARAVAISYETDKLKVKDGKPTTDKVIDKMKWSHPLVIYPSDVWIIKGAYNPTIRKKAEAAFMPFVDGVFITQKDGEKSFKPTSKLHSKNPGRYNDFVDKITGGTQLLELDTVGGRDFPEAVALARNIWGERPVSLSDLARDTEKVSGLLQSLKKNKIDKAGNLVIDGDGLLKYKKTGSLVDFDVFISDTNSTLDIVENDLGILTLSRAMSQVFGVKADALFSRGYQSEKVQIVLGLLKLDSYSGQPELDTALRELSGKDLRGNAGYVRDMDRTFGIGITAYQGARDAVVRMIMGEPDVEKAYQAFNLGKDVLFFKLMGNLLNSSGGGGRSR